ncbi:MAG TPA: hypothetical protein VK721_08865 [Solirubrobacteraceae bacterium]|jgi:hypothetical protein|nr:hypothetical protein [Solirubrobacteraceae bacterium]
MPCVLVVLAALLAFAGATASASLADESGPGTSFVDESRPNTNFVDESGHGVIAQNGFGERDNSYAWSMGWFQGKLYVGTGRDVLCVENETTQFFVPLEQKYTINPSLNVRCPANPFDLKLRAEIWQYTPETGIWKRVYRAPTLRNPVERNLRVATDIAYRSMVTFKERDGREALYAAGVSPDEFLPSLLRTHPPRILRSYDGVHWEALKLPAVTVHYPGGKVRPMGYRAMVVWKHHLFVTATPDLTGDGSLFEVTNPSSAHPRLIQVSPPNLDIFEAVTFHGDLYLGCGNATSGYSVWEASGEDRPFVPVITGGAGSGAEITSVVSMHVYRNRLYVGASGWYQNTLPKSEMIRISPDGQWTLVVGNPRKLPNGQIAYPTSGLDDGFDSLFNAHFWRMADFGGGLYVGTNSWAELVKGGKGKGWLGDLLAGAAGYQLWSTCDGEDWFPVTRNAFGDGEYDFGARTLETNGPDGEELYIGSANQAQGTMILDDRESMCSSLINQRRKVSAPDAMIAQATGTGKHKSTLLSWNPSASASHYEVLAASEVNLTVYLQPQPTLASGFQYEGAEPTLTEPETPGALAVNVAVPGQFEPIGTTSSAFFVAHSSAHRVYEVIAENAAGQKSEPSNVQTMPTPEPAATFGSVRGVLGTSALGRASIARAGSPSPAQRLLDAAQAAAARGEKAQALHDLQRLRTSSDGNGDLSALTLRLERALRYASVVGEP